MSKYSLLKNSDDRVELNVLYHDKTFQPIVILKNPQALRYPKQITELSSRKVTAESGKEFDRTLVCIHYSIGNEENRFIVYDSVENTISNRDADLNIIEDSSWSSISPGLISKEKVGKRCEFHLAKSGWDLLCSTAYSYAATDEFSNVEHKSLSDYFFTGLVLFGLYKTVSASFPEPEDVLTVKELEQNIIFILMFLETIVTFCGSDMKLGNIVFSRCVFFASIYSRNSTFQELLPLGKLKRLQTANFFVQYKKNVDERTIFEDWPPQWFSAGLPRIEIPHKLAASFALTDVYDEQEFPSPWEAWTLLLPDGLFDYENLKPRRVWCLGAAPVVIISDYNVDGTNVILVSHAEFSFPNYFEYQLVTWSYCPENKEVIVQDHDGLRDCADTIYQMVTNLVGCILQAMDSPDVDVRKGRWGGVKKKKGKKRTEAGFGLSYKFGANVKIDFTRHIREVISRRDSRSLTVQYVRRGHWRNQPHGPGRSQRRRQWIKPHWVGNPEAAKLLRGYTIKGNSHGPMDTRPDSESKRRN